MAKLGKLSEVSPQLAQEFDYSKNPGLSPDDFSAGSDKKIWWTGACGHSWQASVGHRVRGRGCPICSGNLVATGVNDLGTTHPHLSREWDAAKNEGLLPTNFSAGSNKRVWWKGSCGHSWQAAIAHRTNGTSCPVCDGKVVMTGVNDLATTHPNVAMCWHGTKNSSKPDFFHAGSPVKAWFICEQGHEYEMAINSKTRLTLGCPICSKKVLVPGVNDLATTNPEIAARWHPTRNAGLSPTQVTTGSSKKAWFICDQGHEYNQQISSTARYRCGKCAGRSVVSGENDLATLRPDLAAEWNFELNDRLPSQVMLGSDYLAWWIDEKQHVWKQGVQVRSRGVGCPKCAQIGYDQTSEGMLYFIRHEKFGARKIGITNTKSKFNRLDGFKELGWSSIQTYTDQDGSIILAAETQLLRWLRKDLQLPAFLGKSEMGRMGGNSETFSGEGVSDSEVLTKIEDVINNLRKSNLI